MGRTARRREKEAGIRGGILSACREDVERMGGSHVEQSDDLCDAVRVGEKLFSTSSNAKRSEMRMLGIRFSERPTRVQIDTTQRGRPEVFEEVTFIELPGSLR